MKIHTGNQNMTIQTQHSNIQRVINKENATGDSNTSTSVQDVTDPSAGGVKIQSTDGNETDAIPAEEEEDKLMAKSVDQANQSLKLYDRKLELSIHEVTKTVMYTLRDTKTNEVIAEFPPKKIQDMIAKMWELAGLFVDKKA